MQTAGKFIILIGVKELKMMVKFYNSYYFFFGMLLEILQRKFFKR